MPTIAGYADLAEIKGQYYRYAGCPIPVASSTVNVNTDLENLIAKAIIVTKGQNGGDLPPELGSYLLMTVEYGNSNYLQTAYSVESGYEYRRFKFGATAWKDWKDATLYGANDTTDLRNTVKTQGNAIDKINNTTIPRLIDSDDTYTIKKAMDNAKIANTTANNALSLAQSANSKIDTTSVTYNFTPKTQTEKWSVQSISAYRSGNVVQMQLIIKGGKSVSAGGNAIEGTFSGGPLPSITTYGVGYYGTSALVSVLTPTGAFALRLLIDNQSLGTNTTSIGFTFVVPNDGTAQESTPESVVVQWDAMG